MKALVTGASQGIGEQICRRLNEKGYAITLVSRREDKLQALASELGEQHDYCVADLSLAEDRKKVVNLLEDGCYNLLVNNAGYGSHGDFISHPMEQYDNMIDLNIKAVVELSYAFLKNADSGDALMNVSSVVGLMPMPGFSVYSATKGFVTFFSETLWNEYKDRGVFITNLCPGMTWTGFQERAGVDSSKVPKGMTQTPEQVAETAIRALEKRSTPSPVSGTTNKIVALLAKLLPRKVLLAIMEKV